LSWTVIWSEFSENQLDAIYKYYCEKASSAVAEKLVTQLILAPNQLLKSQFIGQVEEQLIDLETDYRYLVFKSYKLIYSVNVQKKQVKIADVFDTRQNPVKMKRAK
jgi:plasmid stabilization system protein ParE